MNLLLTTECFGIMITCSLVTKTAMELRWNSHVNSCARGLKRKYTSEIGYILPYAQKVFKASIYIIFAACGS